MMTTTYTKVPTLLISSKFDTEYPLEISGIEEDPSALKKHVLFENSGHDPHHNEEKRFAITIQNWQKQSGGK